MANRNGAICYGWIQFTLQGGSEIWQYITEIHYNEFGFWWVEHKTGFTRTYVKHITEIKIADIKEIWIVVRDRKKVDLNECIKFLEQQQKSFLERCRK